MTAPMPERGGRATRFVAADGTRSSLPLLGVDGPTAARVSTQALDRSAAPDVTRFRPGCAAVGRLEHGSDPGSDDREPDQQQ